MSEIPDFDHLPRVEGMPQGCAWGLWDKNGKKDVYGTLNLLTPDVIKAAYSELKDGVSVSLNWPLNGIKSPAFGRKGLVHNVFDLNKYGPIANHGYDDEVEFNTQSSSQWDSLCHFHHQPSARGYNGVKTSVAELTQTDGNEDVEQKLPTLNHWHRRGGLVARGVLIDFKNWADEQGQDFDPYAMSEITIADIEEIAKKQGVEFKLGDVVLIRSGFTEGLSNLNADEQTARMKGAACGVTSSIEAAKWFWNKHFAAVVGDTIAFEHIPTSIDGEGNPKYDLYLHQYFLRLFGMSIGELWDLKELSQTCKKLNRYTFLLTSAPLNYPGSVASPPNALALF